MKFLNTNIFPFLLLIIVLSLGGCIGDSSRAVKPLHDFPVLKERGKLVAVTDYNSTSYFIYRGTPMGYQYELLKRLAEHLGLELELIVKNDLEDAFSMLNNNECDILAINLTVTNARKKEMSFTNVIGETRQVLVQKKPDGWQNMARTNVEKQLIRKQMNLAGKTVHVMKNSSFVTRLNNLANEIGDTIHTKEVENFEEEQLIRLVSLGEIDYTVADENVALLNQRYYPDIDVKTAISFAQKQAWAVNKNSPLLLKEVNEWLAKFKKTARYAVIYNKYYKGKKASMRGQSEFISLGGGKISVYDNYIKEYSKTIDWDWRLLASLIYQESRFNPKIKSWAGAYGLMQLMPPTAKRFGASQQSTPEVNIMAGTKFIKWLDNRFIKEIPDKDERIKFILASYNVGMGHVLDARRLAEANGKDKNVWTDNVDFFILNKSNPEYYDSELVKYGYIRGHETFNYVRQVMARYENYKKVIH